MALYSVTQMRCGLRSNPDIEVILTYDDSIFELIDEGFLDLTKCDQLVSITVNSSRDLDKEAVVHVYNGETLVKTIKVTGTETKDTFLNARTKFIAKNLKVLLNIVAEREKR